MCVSFFDSRNNLSFIDLENFSVGGAITRDATLGEVIFMRQRICLPMYTARFKAAHERKDYRFSVWPIDRRRKLVESSPRVDLFGPRFNFAKTIVKSSFALDSHRPE